MISRILTAAVLSAGVAVFFSPAFAQTGAMATGTTGATVQGNTGMMGNTGMSGSQTGSMQTGTMPSGGTMQSGGQVNPQRHVSQAQAGRRMNGRGADAMERQVTEYLNNAAANHTAFDACRR